VVFSRRSVVCPEPSRRVGGNGSATLTMTASRLGFALRFCSFGMVIPSGMIDELISCIYE